MLAKGKIGFEPSVLLPAISLGDSVGWPALGSFAGWSYDWLLAVLTFTISGSDFMESCLDSTSLGSGDGGASFAGLGGGEGILSTGVLGGSTWGLLMTCCIGSGAGLDGGIKGSPGVFNGIMPVGDGSACVFKALGAGWIGWRSWFSSRL